MINLLQRNRFQWGEEATISFNKLKEILTMTRVLIYPDFQIQFVVETDAYDIEVGAILVQV